MCEPDMVWRPKQEISHEKRCLLDAEIDGNVPALPPLGPDHPAIFNHRSTTQRPYSQTYPPRPTRPSYTPTTYRPARPTYRSTYGVPVGQPLG